MVKPVITGTTGIVTKDVKKSLETIPGKPSTLLLQKTIIGLLRKSHTILEVLQSAT
jgi:hypothetical protein